MRKLLFFGFLFICTLSAVLLVFYKESDRLAEFAWDRHYPALALILVRSDVSLAMTIGNYYFGSGDYHLPYAAAAYQKAIKSHPAPMFAHYELGRIFFVEGKSDAALLEINAELAEHPENLRSLYMRGLIEGTMQNYSAAESDFKRFVSWEPTEWAGYNDLAWILLREEKYQEAVILMSHGMHVVVGGDKNPWLWNQLGVARLNMGDNISAEHAFQEALLFANGLSANDWAKAYPGNDPETSSLGLEKFKRAIGINLDHAKLDQMVSQDL